MKGTRFKKRDKGVKRQLAYIGETRISNADRKNNLQPNVPVVKVPGIAGLYDKDVSTP